jgi:uncharacterized protein with LGFP repeats
MAAGEGGTEADAAGEKSSDKYEYGKSKTFQNKKTEKDVGNTTTKRSLCAAGSSAPAASGALPLTKTRRLSPPFQ